jgi:hypothetical protein
MGHHPINNEGKNCKFGRDHMATDLLLASSHFSLLCGLGKVPGVLGSIVCLLTLWAGTWSYFTNAGFVVPPPIERVPQFLYRLFTRGFVSVLQIPNESACTGAKEERKGLVFILEVKDMSFSCWEF